MNFDEALTEAMRRMKEPDSTIKDVTSCVGKRPERNWEIKEGKEEGVIACIIASRIALDLSIEEWEDAEARNAAVIVITMMCRKWGTKQIKRKR